MVPESTLKELETACIAATDCLNRIVIVKTEIESRRGEVAPALLAETIREPACKLLESWRALNVALNLHVQRDFIAVCKEPVEIGEVVLAESAHSAAFWLSHHALVSLSIVLMPAGYWPSSEDPETDCFLADLRSETHVDVTEGAVRALRTVFDQLSLRELRKCIVLVFRECAAARAQLRLAGKGEDVESLERCKPSERKAYYSFKLAEAKVGRRLEDREAWDLLQDNDWSESFAGELTDYEFPPTFGTWARQLRVARKAAGERKYTPRTHK